MFSTEGRGEFGRTKKWVVIGCSFGEFVQGDLIYLSVIVRRGEGEVCGGDRNTGFGFVLHYWRWFRMFSTVLVHECDSGACVGWMEKCSLLPFGVGIEAATCCSSSTMVFSLIGH